MTSCATKTVEDTKVEKQYPPETLLKDCPKPAFLGSTWGDLAHYVKELQSAIDRCNASKKALRDWSEE